jgi:phenylacetate-CoA ligase
VSAAHLTTPVEEQLAWLQREDPIYLATFPTNALALLRLSEERGVTLPALRDVVVSSEIVPTELTDLCARVWGATLSRTYSANEVGPIALSHPKHDGYAVQAESVIVEVVDDAGSPCPPGEVGRVLITTLQDGLRPLIRYAIGDYAEWAEVPTRDRASPDGPSTIALPFLQRVTGRERNMLTLPGGGRIWPIFPIKKMLQISPVQQWQMVQTRIDRLLVRVVCTAPLSIDQEARMCEAVAELIPAPMRVELERVGSIARGAGGKYEDFINAVGPSVSKPDAT